MEPMVLIEACGTRYFSDDFVNVIKTALAVKPSIIDTTGARFTLQSLEALAEYFRLKENGEYVCKGVIDNRSLIPKYFETVRAYASYDPAEYTTPIKLPSSLDEYRTLMVSLKEKYGLNEKYKIDALSITPPEVITAFYVILQLVHPELQVYVPDSILSRVGSLLKTEIPNSYYISECPRDNITIMAYGSNLVTLTLEDGKYDMGILGKKTFDEILRTYTIIPPDFGVEHVDRNGSTYKPLYMRCSRILMSFFNEKLGVQRVDLRTALTEGVK